MTNALTDAELEEIRRRHMDSPVRSNSYAEYAKANKDRRALLAHIDHLAREKGEVLDRLAALELERAAAVGLQEGTALIVKQLEGRLAAQEAELDKRIGIGNDLYAANERLAAQEARIKELERLNESQRLHIERRDREVAAQHAELTRLTSEQARLTADLNQMRGDIKTTEDVLQEFDGDHVWVQAQNAVAAVASLTAALGEARAVVFELVKRTPYVPIATGVSVNLTFEQLTRQKEVLKTLDAALPPQTVRHLTADESAAVDRAFWDSVKPAPPPAKAQCDSCGGATGFMMNRGTLDVCDDPFHEKPQKHEQRVVGHASGWQERMPTCVCGEPWPCDGQQASSEATERCANCAGTQVVGWQSLTRCPDCPSPGTAALEGGKEKAR